MQTFRDFKVGTPSQLSTRDDAWRGVLCGLEVERRRHWKPLAQRVACLAFATARAKSPRDLLSDCGVSNALRLAAGFTITTALGPDSEARTERFFDETLCKNADWKRVLVKMFREVCEVELNRQMAGASQHLAFQTVSQRVISCLRIEGKRYRWFNSLNHGWQAMPKYDWNVDVSAGGLSWVTNGRPRTLIYRQTVPIVRNNVDLCLFDCGADDLTKEMRTNPAAYLALGELKGGIDPAGADEHWKTAGSALVRIKSAFAKHKAKPKIFFVGAAVATKMAAEIWAMLKKGDLDNAANLTDDNQLAAVTSWLCSL
ncbi:MAG: type II site-specific deoxyribonuclease [Planctomycetota bacterium]|nr:MAG: type II site-specific deoxyribonuclease [Planctomycetota bacterium]